MHEQEPGENVLSVLMAENLMMFLKLFRHTSRSGIG